MSRTRRGVKVPARSRGTTGLEGPHLRVHRLGRGPVPGVTARLGGRLALVIAQVLGQLSGQAPLQGLLDQGWKQTISPGHAHLPGINLLKQAIQSPIRAQPVNRITPSRNLLCVVISSSHQCQSFHKGLHKPLNRLPQLPPTLRRLPHPTPATRVPSHVTNVMTSNIELYPAPARRPASHGSTPTPPRTEPAPPRSCPESAYSTRVGIY